MHRFYLPPKQACDSHLVLTGREAHHAIHVLRLRLGDRVTVLDGAGQELLCELREIQSDIARLGLLNRRLVPEPTCRITLLQAVPKGKTIESIIQKATELGVWRIVPLLSERVVIQLTEPEAAAKAAKWQAAAIEAIKQCGAAWLPRVEPPVLPQAFLARREAVDLPLIASLQEGSQHPRAHFHTFRTKHGRNPESICVWVGPEGDFSTAEIDAIQAGGALPITLGNLVLRAETAAIYCLSVLNYELQSASV